MDRIYSKGRIELAEVTSKSYTPADDKVFSTRSLLQIICVLGAVVAMKALRAHYDFSWATALAAE